MKYKYYIFDNEVYKCTGVDDIFKYFPPNRGWYFVPVSHEINVMFKCDFDRKAREIDEEELNEIINKIDMLQELKK